MVQQKVLKKSFGSKRVFDTPAAESALTAMGAGMSLAGLRPLLIHQRFDFMIYSLDQIVNWIALWSYKSGVKVKCQLLSEQLLVKDGGKDLNIVNHFTLGLHTCPGYLLFIHLHHMKLKDLCCHQYFLIFQQSSLKVSLTFYERRCSIKSLFFRSTKAFIRSRGKDLTIVSFGPSVKNAIEVSYMLKLQKKNFC